MGFKALKDVLLKTILSGAEKVFVNDNGVIKQTSINNFIVTDPEHTSNKVTTIDSTNTDTQYPSAKCVYTELQNKQNKLTSGDNITIDENNVISATGGDDNNAYVVTVTNGMSDKTPAEITAAWENGQSVYAVTDEYDYILHLTNVSDRVAIFSSTIPDDGYMDTITLAVNYNKSVVVTTMPQQPKLKAGDNITIDKNNKISANVSSMDDTKVNMTGQFAGSSLNQMIAGLNESIEEANEGVWSIGEGLAELFRMKQDKLTAGSNIIIDENNVISATGGSVTDPILENAKETGGIGYTEGEATTIEWDGDTSGLVSVADSLFKVANYTAVTKADLIGCVISVENDDGHPTPFAVEEDAIYDSTIPNAIMVSDYALFVSEPTSYGPYNFEESGIYFAKGDDTYASSLTYTTNKTIHKIDTKYLPEKGFVKIDEDVSVQDVIDIINSGGIPYLRLSSDYDNAIMTPHRVVEYDYMQLVGFIGFGRIEGDVTHDAITQYEIYYQDVSSRDGWSRIYSSTQSCIPEAPVDGKQYARKDGDWSEVVGGSGGEGLQYDFIIVSEDGETYSFEKGSYNAIVSKIKSAPVTGIVRLCLDEYMQYSTHQIMNVQYVCIDPDEDTWILVIIVFGAEGEFQLIINEDNTIVSA